MRHLQARRPYSIQSPQRTGSGRCHQGRGCCCPSWPRHFVRIYSKLQKSEVQSLHERNHESDSAENRHMHCLPRIMRPRTRIPTHGPCLPRQGQSKRSAGYLCERHYQYPNSRSPTIHRCRVNRGRENGSDAGRSP